MSENAFGAQAHLSQAEKRVDLPKNQAVTDGFQMPALEEIRAASQVASELTEAELQHAYEAASELDFSDPIQAMKFGLAEQEAASQVTRDFMGTLKDAGLEALSDIARAQNDRMEQLNIGELKPSLLSRLASMILPGAQAKKVTAFLDKHRSLSEIINEGEEAQATERLKLEKLQEQMKLKIDENGETYKRLTGVIAQAELRYAADLKKVAEFKEQNKESSSQAVARQMNLMDQSLAMEARRINSLKASRQETLNALTVMDFQVNRIHSQMQMIDEQRFFNRLVWDNSVMMAATNSQMQSSVQSITYNRESVEKMMTNRTEGIADTLQKVQSEEKAGVINAAVLEQAAIQLIKMNRSIIDGNKEIRDKMAAADAIIKRLDDQVKSVNKHAAAISQDDLAKLDEFMQTVSPHQSGSDAKIH
jgi:uncharacterized protein YaaN involved in tellurite resistance